MNVTPEQRTSYERIRKIVYKIIPDAEEKISYGIPTFTYKGKYLLYFGAFKNHMSLFPGAGIIEKFADELADFKIAKGTVQFTADKQIPEEVISSIIKQRLQSK